MKLIHTLLFFLRENSQGDDLARADKCLKSLEKSSHKTVVVYNQGFWNNAKLNDYLKSFNLNCIVIGAGINAGIVKGRQACFEYIWKNFKNALFVSELHLDMIFTHNWELPLIDYLNTHNEPVISCGIVEKNGNMPFLNTTVAPLPKTYTS